MKGDSEHEAERLYSYCQHLKQQLGVAQTKIKNLSSDLETAKKSEKFFMDLSDTFRKDLLALRSEFDAFKLKLVNDKWNGEFE